MLHGLPEQSQPQAREAAAVLGGSARSAEQRRKAEQRSKASAPSDPRPVLPTAVVTDRRVRVVLPWVGRAAYMMLAGGFLMTDIFWLRCLLTGGYTGLTIYHTFQIRPLRIPLMGSFFFVCVNAAMALSVFSERNMVKELSEEEADIYTSHFEATMSVKEFKLLMAHGKVVHATKVMELVHAGVVADLVLVLEGRAEVIIPDGELLSITRCGMVGEVSFVGGTVSSATALAVPGSTYIVWRRDELQGLLAREPAIAKCLELRIGQELMRKLQSGQWYEGQLTDGLWPGGGLFVQAAGVAAVQGGADALGRWVALSSAL